MAVNRVVGLVVQDWNASGLGSKHGNSFIYVLLRLHPHCAR